MTTIEDANFALKKVLDAGSQKNVIELAWIKNVRVTIPRVIVTLSLPSFANSQRDKIVQEVRKVLLDFEDIDDVQIEIDINLYQTESKSESNVAQLQEIKGIRLFKRLRTMSNYQIIGNKDPLREIIKGNL